MSRYEEHKNKTYCLRLPEEITTQIKEIAARKGLPASKIYEEAAKEYIEHNKKQIYN